MPCWRFAPKLKGFELVVVAALPAVLAPKFENILPVFEAAGAAETGVEAPVPKPPNTLFCGVLFVVEKTLPDAGAVVPFVVVAPAPRKEKVPALLVAGAGAL